MLSRATQYHRPGNNNNRSLYASQKESETAISCIKYTLVLLPGLVVTRAPLVPVASSRWADVPSSRVPRPWQQDAEEAGGLVLEMGRCDAPR